MPSLTAKNMNKFNLLGGSNTVSHSINHSPAPELNRNKFYQYSTPDYFRINRGESPSQTTITTKTTLNTEESPVKGSTSALPVTIISRTTGWLTVDPETLDRQHAIEKDTKINIRQTSKLAPPWMITSERPPDSKRRKLFKPTAVVGHNVNYEKNRVILAETEQVPKSIFNINQLRHDVHNPEDAGIFDGKPPMGARPSRLIEWIEKDVRKQSYDMKPLAPKVGQTNEYDGGRLINLKKIRKNL